MLNRILFLCLLSSSCVQRNFHSSGEVKAEFAENGIPTNWGNLSVAQNNRVEAVVANSAAKQLNTLATLHRFLPGWQNRFQIIDGVASVPLNLRTSHIKPFGDGQTNSSVAWPGWPLGASTVPFIASLGLESTTQQPVLLVELSMQYVEMMFQAKPENIDASLEGDAAAVFRLKKVDGVYRALLVAQALLDATKQPSLWQAEIGVLPSAVQWNLNDYSRLKIKFGNNGQFDERFFPMLFRFPAQSIAEAKKTIPTNHSRFSDGRTVYDSPLSDNVTNTSQALHEWNASSQKANFFPSNGGVHDRFAETPTSTEVKTATGGVDTYVLKENLSGTEVLYVCFDARNTAAEQTLGVPSGAGWHMIGDPTRAETIINNIEKTGIFAGWGVRTPHPFTEPAPFDAKDIANFRVLRHGENFTTIQNHFHWYAVDATKKVCVSLLKHGCSLKSDFNLNCQ